MLEGINWDWAALGSSIHDALELEITKPVLESATAGGLEKAKSLWSKVKWPSAEQAYRQRLLPFVSTTRLLGNPKAVNIDQLYTDIFVYSKVSALRRTATLVDPRSDAHARLEGNERYQARDVVATGENVYLLGHPGAGKTTFLRYLAILCCKGLLAQVPVYLQLRDVARSYQAPKSPSPEEKRRVLHALLYDAVVNEFDICSLPEPKRFVDELFKSGRALVLIDGLDEVPSTDGMRDAVIDSIRDLARRFPKIQLCVTCRIAASEYAFEHFTYAEVAHFTEEQQTTFIEKWYVDDHPKGRRMHEAWIAERSRPLRDLGRTPLLLALICLAFDDLQELPERYVDLYRESLEALLKRWDTTRSIFRDPFYGSLNPHRREQLLQELAAALFQRDKISFSADDVKPIVDGWFRRLPDTALPDWTQTPVEELLNQIEAQHGLVIQRARGVYSFSHLSIQEFLCAKSIVEGHSERQLEHVADTHMLDPKWREVIVFCAGLLHDGTRLLQLMAASTRQHINKPGNLPAFLAQVGTHYLSALAHGTKIAPDYPSTDPAMVRSPRAIALAIVRRLDQVKWAGPQHPLRAKAAIAWQLLTAVEADPANVFADLAQEGSTLAAYLQAVRMVVDCACVATCAHRERILSPLLSTARS